MRTVLIVLLAGITAAAAAAPPAFPGQPGDRVRSVPPASGRNCMWDNIPSSSVRMAAHASQNDTVYPFRAGSADDFICGACASSGAGCLVESVQWFGTYFNGDPPGNATAFEINFYADAGNRPTGAGLANPRPTALFALDAPVADVSVYDYGNNLYQYDYTIPPDQRPVLRCHEHYWLEIVSVSVFPPQWGLLTAAYEQTLATAVEGFPALGMPYWEDLGVDLPFRLWSECLPPVPGDLNCDAAVNNQDIDGFILALFDPDAYAAQYPNCDWLAGDFTGDGAVNNQDIDGFVAALFGLAP